MFAIFNLGMQELIILLVIGAMMIAGPIAVIVLIVFLNKRGQRRDEDE